ncbi:hypothetical protein CRM22_005435 [Opisthorchis felineus]|uniref:Programmed cell death protein 5 n=1 Tax=Opisthorchis felineus TaxID=147828 RepID=A0A4S2LYC1_OPIFE|nr:hypothetical protein CRM22_005435 [Opisthorchis felineus]TGZ66257.1 hypothetical protein CRM22_005435 [Opisthorchis felineus]
MSGDEDDEKKLAAKERQKEMRAGILAQILDQNARARLNTLAITKPEKAQMVENMLINMAQTGRIGSKLSEDQLKQILTQMSSGVSKSTTVKAAWQRDQRHNVNGSVLSHFRDTGQMALHPGIC